MNRLRHRLVLVAAEPPRASASGAVEAYADLLSAVAKLRAQGFTLRAIANELNVQGHVTRRGRPWNPVRIRRSLQRATVRA